MSPWTRAFLVISNGICVLGTCYIKYSFLSADWEKCHQVMPMTILYVCDNGLSSPEKCWCSGCFVFLYLWNPPREEVRRSSIDFTTSSRREVWRIMWVVCVSTCKEPGSRSPIFSLCYRGRAGGSQFLRSFRREPWFNQMFVRKAIHTLKEGSD